MNERTKYHSARVMSGITQENAVEFLHTSVSNLRRIESGQQRCGPDMAIAMAELYKAPWVADPTVPDDYQPLPLTQAMLRYIKEHNEVNAVMHRATAILADGIVDASEQEEFAGISREIREARDAARDLLYAG